MNRTALFTTGFILVLVLEVVIAEVSFPIRLDPQSVELEPNQAAAFTVLRCIIFSDASANGAEGGNSDALLRQQDQHWKKPSFSIQDVRHWLNSLVAPPPEWVALSRGVEQ
jgi:hypothetical protein